MQGMSQQQAPDRDGPRELSERWAGLDIAESEFVVYDRENHLAWVQSTMAFKAEKIR